MNGKKPMLRTLQALALAWAISDLPGGALGIAQEAPARASHLVIIGVDGMSPDGIDRADTPTLDRLRERGAWSFHARACCRPAAVRIGPQ
jgi:predicted AlkP superfamily pyrophosphatase or phosphodiesterase